MNGSIRVAVDANGGDHAPQVVLEGVDRALASDDELNIVLCGTADVVEPFCAQRERCEALVATEVISMGEHPANAVRTKRDSSIVAGCKLVGDGGADGFFSAGSTGACLAAATLFTGRVRGVKRPALGQVIPAFEKPVLLADVGANADCKPEYLVQFAQMASVYMREVMDVAHPVVGLLNIGEEDAKGSASAIAAHEALRAAVPGFAGNCEPGDMLQGAFDVVVADGFTGNIALKTIEGTSNMLFAYLKRALASSLKAKAGAALARDALSSLKVRLSSETYGGCPLLGVAGACVIGHGSSSAVAVANGIAVCARTARMGVADIIACALEDSNGGAEHGA